MRKENLKDGMVVIFTDGSTGTFRNPVFKTDIGNIPLWHFNDDLTSDSRFQDVERIYWVTENHHVWERPRPQPKTPIELFCEIYNSNTIFNTDVDDWGDGFTKSIDMLVEMVILDAGHK